MDEKRRKELKRLGKAEVERQSAELRQRLHEENPFDITDPRWVKTYKEINARDKALRQNETSAIRKTGYEPYAESDVNFLYNLLFCDDISLFKRQNAKRGDGLGSGKVAIFEGQGNPVEGLAKELISASQPVVNQIGPWNKQRLPPPRAGNVRMTFLVSDGLYFGEGPFSALQQDSMAGPVLARATQLLLRVVELVTK